MRGTSSVPATNRARCIWFASGAFILCLFGVLVVLFWQREPRYEGRPLSYWLEGLQPTVITRFHSIRHWPNQKFRNASAGISWNARSTEMHERASRVLQSAGPECLPILLARLKAKPSAIRTGFLRRCAYSIGLTDSTPLRDEDWTEVRRGQALTAILLLGDRAAPLVPHLSVLVAEDKDDPVHRTATYALYRLAPDEFRRIRAPANTLATAEPDKP